MSVMGAASGSVDEVGVLREEVRDLEAEFGDWKEEAQAHMDKHLARVTKFNLDLQTVRTEVSELHANPTGACVREAVKALDVRDEAIRLAKLKDFSRFMAGAAVNKDRTADVEAELAAKKTELQAAEERAAHEKRGAGGECAQGPR